MPATLRVPVAGWPKKLELGPLSSGQGKLMQFVDPDRIEQSDRVQAASFAPAIRDAYLYQMVAKPTRSRLGQTANICDLVLVNDKHLLLLLNS